MTIYKTLDLDLLAAAGSDSFALERAMNENDSRERAGMKAAEDAAEADDLDDDPTEAEAICQALDRADPDDRTGDRRRCWHLGCAGYGLTRDELGRAEAYTEALAQEAADEEPDVDDEPPPDYGPHPGAVLREFDDDCPF